MSRNSEQVRREAEAANLDIGTNATGLLFEQTPGNFERQARQLGVPVTRRGRVLSMTLDGTQGQIGQIVHDDYSPEE